MEPLQFGLPGGPELLILLLLLLGVPAAAFYFAGKSRGQSKMMERMDTEDSEDQ